MELYRMNLVSRVEIEALAIENDKQCISIFMPTHRAGPATQQDPIRLKNLLRSTQEQLLQRGLRRPKVDDLLQPARNLISSHSFWQHQSDGLALFLASKMFRAYRLPLDFEELLVVGDHFHLKPLLPLLSEDGRFYILALSQNEIRLLQGTRYSVGQIDLDTVPKNLADLLKWDDPEQRLQWHTGTGPRTNSRAAVFHGHGVASADDPKDHIFRYFRKIDDAVNQMLAGDTGPLLLAGVDYMHPIYRDANSYPHLLVEGILGNPEELSAEELHKRAWGLVQPLFERERKKAADYYSQLAGEDTGLASCEVGKVVPAAYHGRVEYLFVAVGSQRWGAFEQDTSALVLHEKAAAGDEDLLDLAAVYTFLNGGTVYAVGPESVPGEGALAAVFRF
jgi:hypothetical protein